MTDTGIGIPRKEIPNLGQPFHRLENVYTTGVQGTRHGLAIVMTLSERMGGRVSIDSEPGAGTTVAVDLPRA